MVKEKIGDSVLNFATFRTMAVDHDRILEALDFGIKTFLPAPVQFEVVFVEVDRLPSQDFLLPELAMSPEEFSRLAKKHVQEIAAAERVTAAMSRDVSRRLVELAQAYEDVRFHKANGTVGGTFRPGTVTVYLTPGLSGSALTERIIGTVAHETYHAASFRIGDRRRGLLRQHLTYQDERGFAVLEEIMACFYSREVCRKAGCQQEVEDYSVNREILRLGNVALTRLGLSYQELNGFWLLNAPSLESFWADQGDAVFRGLHLMPKA